MDSLDFWFFLLWNYLSSNIKKIVIIDILLDRSFSSTRSSHLSSESTSRSHPGRICLEYFCYRYSHNRPLLYRESFKRYPPVSTCWSIRDRTVFSRCHFGYLCYHNHFKKDIENATCKWLYNLRISIAIHRFAGCHTLILL